MKDYNYQGILDKDIEVSKKKFDYKTFLNYNISSIIIVSILTILTINLGMPLSVIMFFIGIFAITEPLFIFKTIKKSKEDSKEATNKLIELYESINMDKNIDKKISETRMKECVFEKKKTEQTKDKAENIITYFYLLDKQDQIQVLKQIVTILKFWGKEFTETRLYLLEEEDIENEKIKFIK